MKGLKLLFAAALLQAPLALTAGAEPTTEGVTIDDIATALAQGLNVERDTTPGGNKVVHAQGKNHTILAGPVGCASNGRCEGVLYLDVRDKQITDSFANSFNSKNLYAKLYRNKGGQTVITHEQVAYGGVTSANLLQNALFLMVKITDFEKDYAGSVAMGPAQPQREATAQLTAETNTQSLRLPPGTRTNFQSAQRLNQIWDEFVQKYKR